MRGQPSVRPALITQAAPGEDVIVPAGKAASAITVVNYVFTMNAAGTVAFVSSPSGRVLGGPFDVEAKGGLVCPDSKAGWMETDQGESLSILTTGGRARGHLAYERTGV
jgi:hypothetical protein